MVREGLAPDVAAGNTLRACAPVHHAHEGAFADHVPLGGAFLVYRPHLSSQENRAAGNADVTVADKPIRDFSACSAVVYDPRQQLPTVPTIRNRNSVAQGKREAH